MYIIYIIYIYIYIYIYTYSSIYMDEDMQKHTKTGE